MIKFISTIISLALSACLLYGIDQFQQFAYITILVLNVICWPAILAPMTDDLAKKLINYWYIGVTTRVIQIYALIITEHTNLAASSMILSVILHVAAYKKLYECKEAEQ